MENGEEAQQKILTQVIACYTYEATQAEDLEFQKGDIIVVLAKGKFYLKLLKLKSDLGHYLSPSTVPPSETLTPIFHLSNTVISSNYRNLQRTHLLRLQPLVLQVR